MSTSLQSANPIATPPVPQTGDKPVDPFLVIIDQEHGEFCRAIEHETRARIHLAEEQAKLAAFMKAANAD